MKGFRANDDHVFVRIPISNAGGFPLIKFGIATVEPTHQKIINKIRFEKTKIMFAKSFFELFFSSFFRFLLADSTCDFHQNRQKMPKIVILGVE